MFRYILYTIRSQEFSDTWNNMPIADRLIWFYFVSVQVALITILELFLIR